MDAISRRSVLAATALLPWGRESVAAAEQKPFLSICGALQRYSGSRDTYEMSEAEFMALPQACITTSTPWCPRSRFSGPLLSDVLRYVGASGSRFAMQALNDYTVAIPASDLPRYGVILAHSREGQRMTLRSFGPLWAMYPRDDFLPELNSASALAKYIWQICRITAIK